MRNHFTFIRQNKESDNEHCRSNGYHILLLGYVLEKPLWKKQIYCVIKVDIGVMIQ